jgi:hypothetical protein
MTTDLKSADGLREASRAAIEQHRRQYHLDGWLENLSAWLARVAAVDHGTFVSAQFQQELWDSETISATGQGHIDVSRVIADRTIAERLWTLRQAKLPDTPQARSEWLGDAWDEIAAMVRPLTDRWPRLKMYRVFASLWPGLFTTVAHYHKLLRLGRAMGLSRGIEHRTELHQRVLERLDEVGAATSSPEERMTLPWLLFVHFVQDKGSDATEVPSEVPGDVRLNPLPADRRRRGMLAIAGLVPSVLAMLEFARDGCKRADFLEHIRSVNPKLAPSSLATNLNALIAEWGVLRAVGDDLQLTPRGEALLESGEPEEVSDWLLTRILGFDNLLHMLLQGPLPHKQVIANLQQVNPGWTSDFAPTVLINWAKGMELAEVDSAKVMRLTGRGRDWASRIHWTPGFLAPIGKPEAAVAGAASARNSDDLWSQLPSLATINAAFPPGIAFGPQLVARLHAGLWNRNHPRRHFAVLTGLSGAGKTLLAMCYARGLWAGQPEQDGWYVVPVQPGWHDPSSLLGYVNPIDNDVYVRTGFLDFLLRAHADPDRPYTVLLDEMNLSHPEQYLAPLLSAMESGGDIELHALGDEVGDVPARIPYPGNLVLIGTVNMDETTHGLSDKVLDRASVIEFWDIDVDAFPGWKTTGLAATDAALVRDVLGALMKTLRPARLHFGWRTIGDVIGYVEAAIDGGAFDAPAALDHAIYSKVLPKLRGEDTPRLRKAFDEVESTLRSRNLAGSANKVAELATDLRHLGSARFWR